jgi:hypothetical protein
MILDGLVHADETFLAANEAEKRKSAGIVTCPALGLSSRKGKKLQIIGKQYPPGWSFCRN